MFLVAGLTGSSNELLVLLDRWTVCVEVVHHATECQRAQGAVVSDTGRRRRGICDNNPVDVEDRMGACLLSP